MSQNVGDKGVLVNHKAKGVVARLRSPGTQSRYSSTERSFFWLIWHECCVKMHKKLLSSSVLVVTLKYI
jgi:hypothetical protein